MNYILMGVGVALFGIGFVRQNKGVVGGVKKNVAVAVATGAHEKKEEAVPVHVTANPSSGIAV